MAPVIYIFFNRPAVTRRTFTALRAMRPSRLHLIADGPRPGRPGEADLCAQTRAIVEELLDWPCTVTRDYAATNLGCGPRVSSGLTAAFALLGEAMVLEDDILPHPGFFAFCTAMLAAYRDDPHIHAISGFQPLGRYGVRSPVVPSTFNWIWGWASWQRSWRDYRFDIGAAWAGGAMREHIRSYLGDDLNYHWHANNFADLAAGRVDAWDFQWSYTLLAARRVALVSTVNLVENLGFAADATHTVRPLPCLHHLRAAAPASTIAPAVAGPDRFHDRLFMRVILADSAVRLAGLRLLARFPVLGRPLLRA